MSSSVATCICVICLYEICWKFSPVLSAVVKECLADRTIMLQCCVCLLSVVCLSSVALCIVAKRCVPEQRLLLTAYRKSYIRNQLVPK